MGLPDPGGVRRRRRRHGLVRDRDRGADADRLVGRDHRRGAHLARDDADPPLRLRGAEASAGFPTSPRAGGSRRSASPSPDAGSDAGATRTTAELRDGSWIVNGSKLFITNAGTDITWGVTITARTGEDEISNLVVENGTPGYVISAPMKKLGWRASDTRELSFEDCAVPEENLLGAARRGVPPVPRDPRRRPHLRRRDGRRARAGRVRPRLRVRAGARAVRQADRVVPGDPLQARGHGDRDRGRPRARAQGRVAEGPGPAVRARGGDGEALHGRALQPGRERRAPDPRRLRLHGGVRRSRASTATRRSSRSARARTRCSGWSSLAISVL